MPALEITAAEWAHHIAMMGRSREIHDKLRPASRVRSPVVPRLLVEEKPPVCEMPMFAARPKWLAVANQKLSETDHVETERHPLDANVYPWPLCLPAFAPDEPPHFGSTNWPKMKVKDIIEQVAADAGVNPKAIMSNERRAVYVRPRQFAMWAARTSPYIKVSSSLLELGRQFGNRDHTTVLHAVRKVQALVDSGELDPRNPRPWFIAPGTIGGVAA